MNDFLSIADQRVLIVLWDATLKGTVLLTLAGVAALTARRASAAIRHLIFSAALVGALALPALSLLLPEWRVRWIPQSLAAQSILLSEPEPTRPQPVIVPFHQQPISETPLSVFELPTVQTAPSVGANTHVQADLTESAASPPAAELNPNRGFTMRVPQVVTLVWIAGVLLSLTPLAIGTFALSRLTHRCPRLENSLWTTEAAALCGQLGVRQVVTLRANERVRSPLTWGAWRPVLLLPSEATAWSAERRRVVLLHELAHIKRFDWLTQTLAYVACAIYWFNPLAWWVARRMRVEREAACDDAVLAAGSRPADYADELLKLAAAIMQRRLLDWAAVPMARRSTLEGRLISILDGTRNRSALTRSVLIAVVLLLTIVAVPVAMMRAAPESAATTALESNDFDANETMSTESAEKADEPARPLRKFVLIVAGPGALTFEGKSTTWEQLSELLNNIPDRTHTVLEFGISSNNFTMAQLGELQGQAQPLTKQFGFEYFSFVGVHPLGSKSASSTPPPPAGDLPSADAAAWGDPAAVLGLPVVSNPVELPIVDRPADASILNISLEAAPAGELAYFLGNRKLTLEQLQAEITAKPAKNKEQATLFSAQGIPYGRVIKVVEMLQAAGVKRLSLETRHSSAELRDQQVKAAAPPWGETVQGVSARLTRAADIDPGTGYPQLSLAVRNQGEFTFFVAQAQETGELEIDGEWFRCDDLDIKSSSFPPGREFRDIAVTLTNQWHAKDGNAELRVTPGKHTIRFAILATSNVFLPPSEPQLPPTRAVSNPVEIIVTAAQEKPVDGLLQTALRSDKAVWAQNEVPTFQLDLKNTGDKPFEYLGTPELECRLKIDGQWYATTKLMAVGEKLKDLAPQAEAKSALTARLDDSWAKIDDPNDWPLIAPLPRGEKLALEPGKHTVAVLFQSVARPNDQKLAVKAISNELKFVITDQKPHIDRHAELRDLRTGMTEAEVAAYVEGKGLNSYTVDMEGTRVVFVYRNETDDAEVFFRDGKSSSVGFTTRDKTHAWGFSADWGSAQHGLRLGIIPEGGRPEFRRGDHVLLNLSFRNVSNEKVTVGSLTDVNGVAGAPRLFDLTGQEIPLAPEPKRQIRIPSWPTTIAPESIPVKFTDKVSFAIPGVPPGEYRVRQTMRVLVGDEQVEFTSGDAHITIAPQPPWSEAVDGLQVYATAERVTWKDYETPTLYLDLKNAGKELIQFLNNPPSECRVRVDGAWYEWQLPITVNLPAHRLEPGQIISSAVTVPLARSWSRAKDDQRGRPGVADDSFEKLALKPGKHTVQIMFGPNLAAASASTGAVSNVLEINIEPPDSKVDPWQPISYDSEFRTADLVVVGRVDSDPVPWVDKTNVATFPCDFKVSEVIKSGDFVGKTIRVTIARKIPFNQGPPTLKRGEELVLILYRIKKDVDKWTTSFENGSRPATSELIAHLKTLAAAPAVASGWTTPTEAKE